jgi:hypothetical protein
MTLLSGRSPARCSLPFIALLACSAGEAGSDGPEVPPFVGPGADSRGTGALNPTPPGNTGTSTPNSTGTAPAPTGSAEQPGNPQLINGAPAAGSGGSGSTSSNSSMAASAAGATAAGAAGSASSAVPSAPPMPAPAPTPMVPAPTPLPAPPPDVPAGDGSCTGALFCEDFEDYAVGGLPAGAPWANETGGGATLSIDGTNVRGSRSLHVRTADGGHGYIRVNNFRPPGNSFFGRVQLLVNSFPTSPAYAHFVLVEATGAGGGLVRPVGGQFIPGQGATALWGVGNDQGASGDWTSWQPAVPTASARWICYEWQMRAADNNIDVWLDGTAQPALSVSSTSRRDYNGARFAFPTFNTVWFGWWQFQASSAVRDIYLDDLALATTRIGCGN